MRDGQRHHLSALVSADTSVTRSRVLEGTSLDAVLPSSAAANSDAGGSSDQGFRIPVVQG